MVTTFSARFQSIKSRCAPLLGKRRLELQASDFSTSRMISSNSDVSWEISGHRHARDSDDFCPMKRRKKQELTYPTDPTEAVLEKAGRHALPTPPLRRERALPTGSVDLSLVKVVDASEYDKNFNSRNFADNSKDENVKINDKDATIGSEHDIYYSAFYADYASLVQSTRQYYAVSPSESKFNNEDKKSESSSSMGGLSSWTPNSSNQDLNDNKKIDNDNRSDQSSLDEEESSADSSSSESRSPSPLPKDIENIDKANRSKTAHPFSVVG
ncbi:hypothetical protein HJC23_014064 [Cyclotella cryptica]|uniref:Uncharacterized protein n=1 Tax=Cyclotella cryptica TaxID=29204 RepID=A0ABD3QWR4_9STRA|eukprot:CCRYP_002460-RA/>CCRYP_002460-RA protein AED:0.16 eAED:0.16 QI:0/-1/0/1/-1/1/1/0/269